MRIVFDEVKRIANLKKHGLDMVDFEDGFDFDGAVRTSAHPSRTGRLRFGFVGWLKVSSWSSRSCLRSARRRCPS